MRISDMINVKETPVEPMKLVTVKLPTDIVDRIKVIRKIVKKPNAAVYEALIRGGIEEYERAFKEKGAESTPKDNAVAKKPVAKKPVAKKPVAKKSSTVKATK